MYIQVESNKFLEKKMEVETTDSNAFDAINIGMQTIAEDPYVSNTLKASGFEGTRSYPATDDIRIFYTVCEECRRTGHIQFQYSKCISCDDRLGKTILFFDIDEQKIYHN
jgi:hypothetical protein